MERVFKMEVGAEEQLEGFWKDARRGGDCVLFGLSEEQGSTSTSEP